MYTPVLQPKAVTHSVRISGDKVRAYWECTCGENRVQASIALAGSSSWTHLDLHEQGFA